MNDTPDVFRFAPSPNGELHLGHAFSALLNHRLARESGADFLLRIEDIDRARCTPAFERQIEQDLFFLGVDWDGPPRRQSEHFADYAAALEALADEELIYPGFMSRGEIRGFVERFEAEEGTKWPLDPDGAPVYPGLDRQLSTKERERKMSDGERFAWRLDMEKAIELVPALAWQESGESPAGDSGEIVARPLEWGDVVLARFDTPTSYHLAVVVDDALQGVTDVVRGRDLFYATSVHRLLQALLGLPAPRYHHHALILGPDGRKLSKSLRDTSIRALREAGLTAEDIRRMVGFAGRSASESFSRGRSAKG
ncbi:MAG: tRNA glutamyl-Q(34) synthetase GluQRS [Aurantimonas endophytica]|uniref:Glutamyl-Q tRNA(Asp) synthetase n=1 Tax=Aurantimonas endophytica TaxID=1522175 RepID=A0A7W6MS47_9HYPH|nr:tRNA glutamyl-Q(34) synthetase GluQRS [Aurantimonas endophytica]MBB4005673.1 glutamyl-Q tRNA(Asp) synthetase [Aurantimonas endophytica]MCO6406377.1 tRNA glutamyl-Q(34) synthetase GluQRS [Aurantimonas endophytica]